MQVNVYHTMASTNPSVRNTERREFLEYVEEFESFTPIKSIGFYRKAYKDMIPEGKSVLESDNQQAKEEIEILTRELF